MAKRENSWSWPWPWQPDDAEPPFPVRGTPGGWRDPWDEPIDHATLRAEAARAARWPRDAGCAVDKP